MNKDKVLDKLAAYREELKGMGVSSLAVFGSVARGEATADSDVDILVRFDPPVGIFHFTRVKRRLSEILGRPVDLVTMAALREDMRESVLKEAIDAA